MSGTELARHEARAQHGIIEFAEEMTIIRDGNLYPNAGETNGGKLEPWATYCKERWGMGKDAVDKIIRARSVLERRSRSAAPRATTISAAAEVATLPDEVQDEILDNAEKRDDVRAKAKAARKVAETAEQNGLSEDETVEAQIAAANAVKAKPKKAKKSKKHSKFTSNLEQAYYFLEQAADIAQGETLSDVENDYGWNRVAKIEYELGRLREKLYRPEVVKDADDEFAELLSGETS